MKKSLKMPICRADGSTGSQSEDPYIDAAIITRRQYMFSSAIRRFNARRDATGDVGEDAGFPLIELMVVLLILSILLAIAIPTFLGVTKSANDRAAQSNLNTALTTVKSYFENNSQ